MTMRLFAIYLVCLVIVLLHTDNSNVNTSTSNVTNQSNNTTNLNSSLTYLNVNNSTSNTNANISSRLLTVDDDTDDACHKYYI